MDLRTIYNTLKARLTTVNGIQHVDWFAQQYMGEKNGRMFNNPAIFIEFNEFNFTTMQERVQAFEVDFVLHLVSDCSFEGEQRILEQDIDHQRIVKDIFIELQGISLDDGNNPAYTVLNEIERTKLTTDHELDALFVTLQEFRAVGVDRSAYQAKQTTTAQHQVTFTIQ